MLEVGKVDCFGGSMVLGDAMKACVTWSQRSSLLLPFYVSHYHCDHFVRQLNLTRYPFVFTFTG